MTLGGSRPMQPDNMAVCSLCFKGDYRTGGGRMIYFFPLPFAILMVSHFGSSTFRRADLKEANIIPFAGRTARFR